MSRSHHRGRAWCWHVGRRFGARKPVKTNRRGPTAFVEIVDGEAAVVFEAGRADDRIRVDERLADGLHLDAGPRARCWVVLGWNHRRADGDVQRRFVRVAAHVQRGVQRAGDGDATTRRHGLHAALTELIAWGEAGAKHVHAPAVDVARREDLRQRIEILGGLELHLLGGTRRYIAEPPLPRKPPMFTSTSGPAVWLVTDTSTFPSGRSTAFSDTAAPSSTDTVPMPA